MFRLFNIIKELQEISSYPGKWFAYVLYFIRMIYWYTIIRPFHISFIGKYYGVSMYFNSFYDGCRYAYVFPQKDYWIKQIILSYSDNSNTFIDVGGNIGSYGLLAAKNGTQVHFFEPNKELNTILKKSIGNNIFNNNIHISNNAVADKNKTVFFYKYNPAISQKSTIIQTNIDTNNYITEKVNAITLDSYIRKNHINNGILLKIDTEGADILVIKGLKQTIKKGLVKLIYWETNSQSDYNNILQITKYLEKNQFQNYGYDYSTKSLRKWKKTDKDCLSIHKTFSHIISDFNVK